MRELRPDTSEVTSAAALQQMVDSLGEAGGRIVLPAMELEMDRGIALGPNVELVGQGRSTVLRKAPGRIYPLAGYHNYGMRDVPLIFTDGLEPGMTVAIRDDVAGCFGETFARITWVDSPWVGLDRGLESDYHADQNPVLVTAFPLIYGLDVAHVAVRGLTLDGNLPAQPAGIGACRGAALYFLRSHHVTVDDVVIADFAGEGIGFQMCSHLTFTRCQAVRNSGNGFHPGAGSTAVRFEGCRAEGNGAAGFFFCVRANHITVSGCDFVDNAGPGISIGTRDSHNLIEACRVTDNGGPGILFRETRRPVAMTQVAIRGCEIRRNVQHGGVGEVTVLGDAHAVTLEGNLIVGSENRETTGVFVAPTATTIWLADNQITHCFPPVAADPASLVAGDPVSKCGAEAVQPVDFRHLGIVVKPA